jgi:murein DD-endopeptidase MepM/ murein hydrolase activator NlpD
VAEPGDTVYALARRYQVPTRDIIEINRLEPPFRLTTGQRVRLPRVREHVVAAGETFAGIAASYGLNPVLVAEANGLAAPYRVSEGQRLSIPAAAAASGPQPSEAEAKAHARSVPPAAPAPAAAPPPAPPPAQPAEVAAAPPPSSAKTEARAPPETPAEPPAAAPAEEPLPARKGFIWPVRGKVISSFGPKPQGRQNDGINIQAPRGTAVRAAEGGVVAYAGNELRGFGNLVLVQHADGWITAYAHNEELLVGRGDRVSKGQAIARVGSSGSVSQPQLHFQLRKGQRAVDPRKYLPTS